MVQVVKSTILNAPIEAVWAQLRDFNAHDQWHPEITQSEVEDGRQPDEVGAVRNFSIKTGGRLRERLISLSDKDRTLSYCLLETPIPLLNYVSTIELKSVTDGNATYWQWQSKFSTPPGMEHELATLVGENIYEAGFEAIRKQLDPYAAQRASSQPVRTTTAPLTGVVGQPIESSAIMISVHGGPEVMALQTISAAPPGPGEIRLRHTAIGVNYIDVYCRTGYFDLLQPPGVPGMEAAGVVLDVGPGVDHLRKGERVAYATVPIGAYSTVRTMNAALVIRLPDDIDDETAAAGLLKGMTAEILLHRVHNLHAGEVVLVHAAAGGVGSLICQLAKTMGAVVIGTVSSETKARVAHSCGCDKVVIHEQEDFVEITHDYTNGHGADVVIDGIGAETFDRSFEALAICGHLISYGQASGDVGKKSVGHFATKSARLSRPNFGHYTDEPHKVRAITNNVFDALRSGKIAINTGQRFPLAEAAVAHRALENRETTGSTILIP